MSMFIFVLFLLLGLCDFFLGPYQLVHVKSGVSSWRGSRDDGRTYLLSGAIDGSKANGIICDSKMELEKIGFHMELVQRATSNCKGSCRLTSLERQEVWNGCRSCKVRVSSNGNLLWEVSVLLDRKEGGSLGCAWIISSRSGKA
ncbi:hypothetical protein Tco_0326915 [Tanacetum coccineum]